MSFISISSSLGNATESNRANCYRNSQTDSIGKLFCCINILGKIGLTRSRGLLLATLKISASAATARETEADPMKFSLDHLVNVEVITADGIRNFGWRTLTTTITTTYRFCRCRLISQVTNELVLEARAFHHWYSYTHGSLMARMRGVRRWLVSSAMNKPVFGFQASLAIYNVFDQYYRMAVGSGNFQDTGFMEGRTARFRLKHRF